MLTVGDKFPALKVPVQQGVSALPAGETIGSTAGASAQAMQRAQADLGARANTSDDSTDDSHAVYSFKSRSDSLAWARNRSLAAKSTGYRIVVSLQDHHLWAVVGRDA